MSDFNEKGKYGGQNGVPDNTSSGNPSDPWSINSILKNQDNDIFSSSEIDSGRSFNDTDEIYSGRPSGTDKKREDVPVGHAKSSKSRKKKKKSPLSNYYTLHHWIHLPFSRLFFFTYYLITF